MAESQSLLLAYRNRYHLPLNDPRYLGLDEIDIYRDLSVMDSFIELQKKRSEMQDDDGEEVDDASEVLFGKDNTVYKVSNKEVSEEEADKHFESM